MSTAPAMESFQFQAETTQLLHLMIHSLYTQREVFLRELISNASDALDRLRFEALTNSTLVPNDHKYEIRLKPELATRTLTISDTGIGMNRQELINHIGTIARSGTQELRKRMKESQSVESAADLIGQFGVGFYSAFMVADKVAIITRRAGEANATRWESAGDGTYTLAEVEKAGCGTEIILSLKQPDADNGVEDYTDRWKLAMMSQKVITANSISIFPMIGMIRSRCCLLKPKGLLNMKHCSLFLHRPLMIFIIMQEKRASDSMPDASW